jgi:hypothetical protein
MTLTPKLLRANRQARVMLLAFDFEVRDEDEGGHVWFDTAPLKPFDIVAQRNSGCVYALVGASRHVLFGTSEGQAGIIAANLQECLELVVAHPYWEDILRGGNGDLAAMRAVLRDRIEEFEDNALSDDPEIEDFRPLLRKQLGLAAPSDPLQSLHRAVTVQGAGFDVRDDSGYPAEALAGQ